MTFCSTYIGDLEDPSFKWEGGDWSGNIPRNISPKFPHASEHYNGRFHSWVSKSDVICKQTDFDGWVARVNKKQILDYLHYCYDDDESADLEGLIEFVNTLDDSKQYGLVAECY